MCRIIEIQPNIDTIPPGAIYLTSVTLNYPLLESPEQKQDREVKKLLSGEESQIVPPIAAVTKFYYQVTEEAFEELIKNGWLVKPHDEKFNNLKNRIAHYGHSIK